MESYLNSIESNNLPNYTTRIYRVRSKVDLPLYFETNAAGNSSICVL